MILCLDQATKVSGYSVFKTEPMELVTYGHFTIGEVPLEIRLMRIRNKVHELINQFQPEKIYLEDIQYQTNIGNGVTTYKALAEVIGVLTELAAELNIPCELIHSQTWKSNCGIRGKTRAEQKRNAQKFVLDTYNLKVTQDEADSICLGHSVAKKPSCAW